MKRPPFIKHYSEIQSPDDNHYPESKEMGALVSPFSDEMGLSRIGVAIDVLQPGRRSSWPHAESTEEEFVYVVAGTPDVWIDGELHRLKPGDGVGFPAGTGISHSFLNNTEEDVRILVVGERRKPDNKVYYPLHPHRREQMREGLWWKNVPEITQGDHDGMPDKLRESDIR